MREILDRHEELRSARRKEEPTWRELARLLRPDDRDFDAATDVGRDDSELFDATPLYALESFQGGLFSQLINPANRWFELGLIGEDDLAAYQPVRQWLWSTTSALYGSMSPAVSGFYSSAPAWIGNTGAFGFGPFYQEEVPGRGIIDLTIPIGEIYLDRDADRNYDTVHREFMLTGRQFKRKFGAYDIDDARTCIIVHAVFPNPDFRPGALGPRGKPWASVYCSPDLKDWRIEGGYYELPYHIPCWNRRARSAYPTGPGHNQKADALSLQEMERSHLVAAQFAAEPPLLTTDENALTTADIVPNTLLYGALNEQGKRTLDVLERKQQPMLSMQQSEQRRAAIRTAFYYGLMQLVQRPQMTATEFLGFQEETLKLMAHNLVHIQTGGLSPFIARRYAILSRAGQLPPPPPELAGRKISVEYNSPLAKIQQLAEGRSVLQFQQAIEQMAVTDPSVRDHFNGDVAAPVVGRAFSAVPNILRRPDEIAKIREARAAAQQQQAGLEQLGQAVTIAAEASHASQAATLAKARVKAA